jgi:hypothetical protein
MAPHRPTRAEVSEDDPCEWNTTPILMRGWLRKLPEHLRNLDFDYVTLYKYGYMTTTRRETVVPTLFHAYAIQNGLIGEFDFDNPIPTSFMDDREVPRDLPRMTEEQRRAFLVQPHAIKVALEKLANAITDTITVRATRQEYLTERNRNGVALIRNLMLEARRLGPTADSAISTRLNSFVAIGPSGHHRRNRRVCSRCPVSSASTRG